MVPADVRFGRGIAVRARRRRSRAHRPPPAAQGAGDEQYQDPFAPGDGAAGGRTGARAARGRGEAAPPHPRRPPTGAQAGAAQQLPYTGADVEIVLAAGTALLAGGVALRIRLRA